MAMRVESEHASSRTTVSPRTERADSWWIEPLANAAGLVRMIEAAGFELVQEPLRRSIPPGAGQRRPPLRPRVLRTRAGREALLQTRRGDPHLAVLARPTT